MLIIDQQIQPEDLLPSVHKLFELSAEKIISIHKSWKPENGAPVITVEGKYTSRSWTEWTHGFQFGSALLQFDATGEKEFLEIGRQGTIQNMAKHISHTGVHDHGFNIVSTYGNLLRLMREGKCAGVQLPHNEPVVELPQNESDEWEKKYYELAIKISGAVQASRWTRLNKNEGYIYSFNGPHSLFIDTMRTLRVLCVAHQLGHELYGEQDSRINLLHRTIQHALTTAKYNVYFGEDRDTYDVSGRVAHESIFNVKNGEYRSPNNQQGFSPYTTWMRGLAWCLLGFAEQLEYVSTEDEKEFYPVYDKKNIIDHFLYVARTIAEYYISHVPTDGIPYWDDGAPDLERIPDCLNKHSQPFNDYEPIDSSAAVIAAQGFLRLGNYLRSIKDFDLSYRYINAGFTIAKYLFDEPYLSVDPNHQGLILHSVYHRPVGWDYIPPGRKIPCGESSMWGDYHARELALMILRMIKKEPYYCFYLK